MHLTTLLSTAAILASVLTPTAGHGYLVDPKPTYYKVPDYTTFAGKLDGITILPLPNHGKYNQGPRKNTNNFNAAFKASKYTSLRDLVQKNGDPGGACGLTDPNGDAQPLPGVVKWAHFKSEPFRATHEGPCEVWCDNTRVFQNDNCAANLLTGEMPIDKTKCEGAKQLYFVWVALQSPNWQFYKACVKLQGGGGPTPPSPSSGKPTSLMPSPSPSTNKTTVQPSPHPSPSSKNPTT
ncbi:hypothetical protein As57867_007620, partial [Aphanomyces stellatus]